MQILAARSVRRPNSAKGSDKAKGVGRAEGSTARNPRLVKCHPGIHFLSDLTMPSVFFVVYFFHQFAIARGNQDPELKLP